MKYVLLVGFVSACTLAAQPKPGAGSIEGHVFNSLTSAPVRKASVNLQAPQIWLVAYTDAEGRFQFTALPPGIYKLSASRSGFLDRAARRPIALAENDNVTGAEIRLPPQGVITGHIMDEDGDPIGGARITISKQVYRDGRKLWDKISPNTTTNETGEYRCPNLSPGRYLVQASTNLLPLNNRFGEPPPLDNASVYYPNALNEEAASPVEVGVGADVRGIDIHLVKVVRPPRFRVTGKVVGAQPGTIINVSFGANAGPPEYLFDLSVPSGRQTILAHVYSGGPEAFANESLTVSGNVTGLVLTMSPPPEVTGRIRLADSGGHVDLKGVRVTLNRYPIFFDAPAALSDAMGKLVFARPIAPGHYTIDVDTRSLPDGCFVQKMTLGRQEISEDGVEILTSTPLEILISNTAGAITGSVSDDGRKPFPNSTVTLIPSDARSRPVKQVVDDDGNFKFTHLPPGAYQLFAWEEVDDGLWPDPEFCKKYEGRATKITVGSRQTQNAQLRVIAAEEMK